MIIKTIDLFKESGCKRNGATKGILTVYVPYSTPEHSPKNRPAILIIPGGGYEFTSYREQEPVALQFMAMGFAAFVLEYDCKMPHPVPLQEACMAMKYIRDNAENLNLLKNKVAAIGFSAGGHLLGTLATLYKEGDQWGMGDLLRPDAIIPSYAVITDERAYWNEQTMTNISGGDKELMRHLSIEKQVTKTSPPAFIWHTADDDCVPVENSLMLAAAYKKNRVPFELHVFAHGVHGLAVSNLETSEDENDCRYNADVQAWIPLVQKWLFKQGFKITKK